MQVLGQVQVQVADTGADTKVKICFPRKLIIAKRGQISIWKKTSVYLIIFTVNLHNLTNFIANQLLGTKNHSLILFCTIFDTQGCCKTHLVNKKVSNLALEMCFLSVFCHLTPQPGQLYQSKFISNHPNSCWT